MIGKKVLLFWVLSFFITGVAYGASIEPVLIPPSQPIIAGEQTVFTVYFHNTGETNVRLELKEQLSCRLLFGSETDECVLQAVNPAPPFLDLASKGFAERRFVLLLPRAVNGVSTLQLTGYENISTIFIVEPAHTKAAAEPAEEEEENSKGKYQTLEELFTLYQPYVGNISAYEPMYFLAGIGLEKSKFQLSFKYRIFNPDGSLARKYQGLTGLHLAYTQTAFWDLKAASKPFEDTSYKPGFFFLSSNLTGEGNSRSRLFLQTGYLHESNGRGGIESRSTNFLYLKPILILFNEKNLMGLQLAPKFWVYVDNEKNTNPDLADYRGYFDLEIKAGKADSLVAESHLRYAREGASLQFDLTYPLHRYFGGNLDVYLHGQYVNALAESLLNYRQRIEALRLGISIVR